MAPAEGLEPTTLRLTVECSTIELRRTNTWRPRPESNRRKRICSPLHHHSATRPETTYVDKPHHGLKYREAAFYRSAGKGGQAPINSGIHADESWRANVDVIELVATVRYKRLCEVNGILQQPWPGRKGALRWILSLHGATWLRARSGRTK